MTALDDDEEQWPQLPSLMRDWGWTRPPPALFTDPVPALPKELTAAGRAHLASLTPADLAMIGRVVRAARAAVQGVDDGPFAQQVERGDDALH